MRLPAHDTLFLFWVAMSNFDMEVFVSTSYILFCWRGYYNQDILYQKKSIFKYKKNYYLKKFFFSNSYPRGLHFVSNTEFQLGSL